MSKRVAWLGPANFMSGHARSRAVPAAQAQAHELCFVPSVPGKFVGLGRPIARSLEEGGGRGMAGWRGWCQARREEDGWPWKPSGMPESRSRVAVAAPPTSASTAGL
jgi:hypothetical protein